MLNPNLSECEVLELVRQDCDRRVCLMEKLGEAALEIARKHGRDEALGFLGQHLWMVL
jgi:hypothetical protein